MKKEILKSLSVIDKETAKIKALMEEQEEVVAETESEVEVDLDTLDGMKVAELRKLGAKLEIEGASKMSKAALIEAITEYYADDEDEDSDDEGDDEETDYEDMEDDELIEAAEEAGIEVPYKGKGKNKKVDRDALIEMLEEADESDEDETDEDEDDDDSDDEDDEDEEGVYEEEDLEEMEDDELVEVCEELEIDAVKKGKKLNRKATIAAILEAQEEDADEDEDEDEDEDGDDDEDESEEDALELYEEEDLDELSEKELKAHLKELADVAEDYEVKMPKGWDKLKGAANLKKAILKVYDQLEDEE